MLFTSPFELGKQYHRKKWEQTGSIEPSLERNTMSITHHKISQNSLALAGVANVSANSVQQQVKELKHAMQHTMVLSPSVNSKKNDDDSYKWWCGW